MNIFVGCLKTCQAIILQPLPVFFSIVFASSNIQFMIRTRTMQKEKEFPLRSTFFLFLFCNFNERNFKVNGIVATATGRVLIPFGNILYISKGRNNFFTQSQVRLGGYFPLKKWNHNFKTFHISLLVEFDHLNSEWKTLPHRTVIASKAKTFQFLLPSEHLFFFFSPPELTRQAHSTDWSKSQQCIRARSILTNSLLPVALTIMTDS